MNTYIFDTESCGYIGPTLLIQYQVLYENDKVGDIILHDIFKEKCGLTCTVIEDMMNSKLVGFNLAHDMWHLARTYNILSLMDQDKSPSIYEYANLAKTEEARRFCLTPVEPLDLMIYGQQGPFQAIMKQAPITLRKIPKCIAEQLVAHLTVRIKINPIYFAGMKKGYHWDIKELWHKDIEEFSLRQVTPEDRAKGHRRDILLEVDPNFVDLVLPFQPKKGLKDIVEHILDLGVGEVKHFELPSHVRKPTEEFWNPNNEEPWIDVIDAHIDMWRHDERQREYAREDVLYTRALYEYFDCPKGNDDGSVLACMVANSYNKGFDIDKKKAANLFKQVHRKCNRYNSIVQARSAPKVMKFLLGAKGLNNIMKKQITNTKAETLELLANEPTNLGKRAKLVLKARRCSYERELLYKLLTAGKAYWQFKVTGAKSGRMSGGASEGTGKSMNPQGMPSDDYFREIFTFSNSPSYMKSGGDVISCQVKIMAKVWNDPELYKELRSGKKFHAIIGSFVFNMSYEDVLKDKDKYDRSKSYTFAKAFGGQSRKLAAVTGRTIEDIEIAGQKFEEKYKGVRDNRLANIEKFEAIVQPSLGGKVFWKEPQDYVESFLGYKRYFTVEIEVMRALFDLATKMPSDLKEVGRHIKVTRRDREQTATGACCSALYGSAFAVNGQIQRAAGNHEIQSPEGQIIKAQQVRMFNKFQPRGIKPFEIYGINVHDELQWVHKPEIVDELEKEVKLFEAEYKNILPMFEMEWFKDVKNWSESH